MSTNARTPPHSSDVGGLDAAVSTLLRMVSALENHASDPDVSTAANTMLRILSNTTAMIGTMNCDQGAATGIHTAPSWDWWLLVAFSVRLVVVGSIWLSFRYALPLYVEERESSHHKKNVLLERRVESLEVEVEQLRRQIAKVGDHLNRVSSTTNDVVGAVKFLTERAALEVTSGGAQLRRTKPQVAAPSVTTPVKTVPAGVGVVHTGAAASPAQPSVASASRRAPSAGISTTFVVGGGSPLPAASPTAPVRTSAA